MTEERLAQAGKEISRPIEQRTKRALERVLDITKEMNVNAVSGLIKEVAEKYERRGPTTAKVYIVGKWDDAAFKDKHNELTKLVQIVDTLEEERLPGAEAGYIIKKLSAIKKFYTPEEPGKEG
jgi:hypothetical protein